MLWEPMRERGILIEKGGFGGRDGEGQGDQKYLVIFLGVILDLIWGGKKEK